MAIPLRDFTFQLRDLIYQLARYYELCDRHCTEQNGVTAAQAYTLLALPDTDSLTMNDLSDKMELANSTMTRMVDQLVEKNLVSRENDGGDRRIVRVRLTEHGMVLKATLDKSLQGFFEQAIHDIPAEERAVILQSFRQVNTAILQWFRACCGPQ